MTIREDTGNLSFPEGRRVGTTGHGIALSYIEGRMGEAGLSFFRGNSYLLPYSRGGTEFTNLAGMIPGSEKELAPVLMGAHYDSAIDGPCSDDNAVSVAVVLAVCERLKVLKPRRTVIAAFFDGEERPYFGTESMGSIRFHEDHIRGTDLAAAIILDAIGHDFEIMVPQLDNTLKRIREFIFLLGSESHWELPAIVEKASSRVKGLRVIPTLNRYIGDSSDYMAFRKAGHPWLFMSRGNGKFTHTMKDNMEWVNFKAVDSVLELLLSMLEELDRANMEQREKPVETAGYEIRMLKRAAGFLLPGLIMYLRRGKLRLKSREDLDELAGRLKGFIGL